MAESLRVVHVVFSLDVGGLERVVLDLVRDGQRLGQRSSILCLERPGALAEAARSLGATVACADKSPGLRVGTIGRLKRVLSELRPDVVHSHQIGALLYAGPAAWWAGVPVVVHTEHGKHYATRWRTRLLGRLAARFAQRFFCVSEDLASEVRRHHIVSSGKVRVVPNGIDTARFAQTGDREGLRRLLNIPASAPVIGTVGRLTEVKRQDILIRAFAALKTKLPEARLLLVGDGERREELEALVRELGLGPSVHFAGYQAEPQAYLQIMDVFALSSRSEGMPLAVLEAWAAGLPVVASRVGGLGEMITNGSTGLLYEYDDCVALTNQLYQVLADSDLAMKLRRDAQRRVREEFDVHIMAERYARHYADLLGQAGARSRLAQQ